MAKMTRTDAFLTVSAVAERLTCSTKTVRRLIERGDLDAVRIGPAGRLIRVSEKALAVYLATRNV